MHHSLFPFLNPCHHKFELESGNNLQIAIVLFTSYNLIKFENVNLLHKWINYKIPPPREF